MYVLYVRCRCMYCMGVISRVWLYMWDVHYVYVHMIEEKALGVCGVWKPI